jgi:voltage-gated potassium channel
LSLLDCIYYATVSLSTTGYGDITPVTPSARLVNVLVITPLRVAFLIVLIGTTVETLTTQSRQALKIQRWRSRVRNHTIVVGYGTKGRTAVGRDGRRRGRARGHRGRRETRALERAKSAACHRPRQRHRTRGAAAWPAPSTRRRSSSPPTATTPPSWSRSPRARWPNAKIIAAVREPRTSTCLEQSGGLDGVTSRLRAVCWA